MAVGAAKLREPVFSSVIVILVTPSILDVEAKLNQAANLAY